jgi:Protein of unknown function (DUF998)
MSSSIQHSPRSTARVVSVEGSWERAREILLLCGITASLLYGAMIWVIQYAGYNPISQTVSELSAWGVSTRPLWLVLGILWQLLMIAFGAGVWESGVTERSLRIAGAILVAYGLLGLAWPFASMHQREVLAAGGATLADTAHLVLVSVGGVLVFAAMAFAAAAFGMRFRLYSLATIVIVGAFAVLTSMDAARVQANLPTPWTGLWERINILAFLAWVVVLAVSLLRIRGEILKSGPRVQAREHV